MGGSSWSSSVYTDRKVRRAAMGTPTFDYDHKVRTGKVDKKVHATLDPSGLKLRESRDSDAHPESLAIGVIFDVTGSMGNIPVTLQTKLAGLMSLLIAKGYVAHPQILFGAIGDANSDQFPLQIGQFESGIEMENDLTNVILEGNGGGQNSETYELAHYVFARHTATDCWEKRGHKGYLFTIGDENFYKTIRKAQVKTLIGDDIGEDLPTERIVREVEERYHVFHIVAMEGSQASHDKSIYTNWQALLGERALKLEDATNVAELIALTIGLNEGTVDIDTGADHLKDAGASTRTIQTVRDALVPLAASGVGSLTKTGAVHNLPTSTGAGATRL